MMRRRRKKTSDTSTWTSLSLPTQRRTTELAHALIIAREKIFTNPERSLKASSDDIWGGWRMREKKLWVLVQFHEKIALMWRRREAWECVWSALWLWSRLFVWFVVNLHCCLKSLHVLHVCLPSILLLSSIFSKFFLLSTNKCWVCWVESKPENPHKFSNQSFPRSITKQTPASTSRCATLFSLTP